ncbi:MAG TPA: carboxypeptidase regulatory-like domain-containing protein, partial [Pyrinomonadaceae bacterium]
GAVGDGVADDGPAIKRALDALADAGGGTLTVPLGRFAILTPVIKDFRGKATNVTIRGVPSAIDPNPKGPGSELTIGLGLVSEFVVKTGPEADALSIVGLDTFLITDLVFIGTPEAEADARIALGLYAIRDAVVRHCEFYGLSTQTFGGAVLHALESGLTLDKSVFLGSTGNSGIRVPVVQNVTWKNFVMTQTIFADYGQRPNYYGKLGLGAPFSWVMLGNPAPTDNLSPRREAFFSNVFFDEGGFIGVASFPDYYDPSSQPADLIHVSNFRMNVSSLNSYGIYIYRGVRNVLIERGEFMLSTNATSAVELVNAGDVILDKLICGAAADTIRADAATRRLTVINSTYNHLYSQAPSTKVINSADPDKDPVQYVRQRFLTTLAREADPAANYFWADLLLQCNDVATCETSRKNELSAYLTASPQPTFSLSGRATKENGSGLSGVSVNLSGSQAVAAEADASGNYIFAGLPTSGDYTLTPGRINYTFTPASTAVSRPAGNRTVNFPGKANRYQINGRLANAAGAPIAGATVTLSGAETATATTDAGGNYSLGVGAEGSYTVTPTRVNYTFTPTSRTFSNVVADQTANFTGTPGNYTITGRVTEGALGLAGVTVTLSGSMAAAKTTDATGNYSFTAIAEGNYTVTATRTHYTLAPPSVTVSNLLGNRTANFAATLNRHAIRGKVTNAAGAPVAGATVTLSGSQTATAAADADGNYTLPNLPAGGSFTVTSTRQNYTFTPASRTFDALGSDQTTDFTGALVSYNITGRVTAGGASLAGATVRLSGSQTGTTTADAGGNYTFTVTAEGNYTVTPSRPNYTFTPASAAFNNLSANAAADFAGALVSYQISGRVTTGGSALAGATVTLSGSSAGVATTDAAGNYTFNVKAEGDYTLTPSHPRHDFAPAARTFSNISGPQAADFAGTLKTYTVSGRVANINNTGIPGATVILSGSSTGTATTNAAGSYFFEGLTIGGAYTVTPTLTHHDLAPTSRTITNLESDQTADFVASFTKYKINGRVTKDGSGLPGVSVVLSGSQAGAATTDAGGNYSFTVTALGNYTVTPSHTNHAFTPASRTFDALGSDQTADFTGALVSYQLTGRVSVGTLGLAGVIVTLSGSTAAIITTDAGGDYTFTVTAEGNYTVTPSLAHYVFPSANAALNNVSANASADFAGALANYKISGHVTDEGAALGGVTVTLSGTRTGTATTDAAGAFSFNGLPALGNYTVTPILANRAFSPSSRTVGGLESDQTAEFTTTQRRLISFGAAAYSASEAAGSVAVTIVRTGDISSAAEVVCSAVNGSAEQRTDLSPVIGTISFESGEASKSLDIFITDDAYLEGAEQLTLMLSDPVGGTLAEQSTTTLTIADNDHAPQAANPIDDAQFFVRQHYRDFFNREPDADGLRFWSGQILSCDADPGCVEDKRINVSAAFFLATEFQETGYFIHRLYKAAYARAPRHVEEFLLDSRQVGLGLVVNDPGWQQLLEDNKAEFATVFVERPDFVNAYPLALAPAEFVGRLNERAGAPLAQAELGPAVGEFAGAATSADTAARARALRLVVESDALRRRELNAAFVLMQYLGYIQRNPDEAPDTDLSGYNFWLTKLQDHGGDFHTAQMVRSFLVSTEYRARFGR